MVVGAPVFQVLGRDCVCHRTAYIFAPVSAGVFRIGFYSGQIPRHNLSGVPIFLSVSGN